jgi:uncharacterized RDD family membrane protein YckC
MSQLSDNENSKDSGKKLSSKEKSLSERLTGTDSDISGYSIAPIPAGLNQPSSPRSFQEDSTKALTKSEAPSASGEREYAGYIRRYFATVIDDFFLYWLVLGFIALYAGAEILSMHFVPRLLGVDFSRQMLDAANIILFIPAIPLCIFLGWFYCAGLESSAMEATPGKRLLGMRVLDTDGGRLTFWRSTRKALIPVLLVLVSIIGWVAVTLFIGFIKGPLAVVGTCVAVVLGLLAAAAFLAACLGNVFFINKKNQTLHDLLSKRIVVKRPKEAPSSSPRPLIRLLPVELKILGLICSAFLVLVAEFTVAAYCNVETKSSTPGLFVLNTSGHIWKAKRALKTGSIVDLKDCYQETLPAFRIPPFALDPSAKLGRMIVCDDIAAGSILTYNTVVPHTIGVSQIISIEPIQESQELNYSVSRVYGGADNFSEQSAKHVDRQVEALKAKYPDEQWLIRILSGEVFRATAPPSDDVDKLRKLAVESNSDKNYAAALGCADKAFSFIFEKYEKQNPVSDSTSESEAGDEPEGTAAKKVTAPAGKRPNEVLEQAIKTSKMLPKTFPFDDLSVEYRAVLTDLLMQRSIAQSGLNQHVKAKVDAANCISLLKSLDQDSLNDRKSEYLALPEFGQAEADSSSSSSSSDAQSEDSNVKTDATTDAKTDAKADASNNTSSTDAGNVTDTTTESTDAKSSKSSAEADTDAAPDPVITDENADRYVSMLAKSDEKRYKDFLRNVLKRLGN